MNSASRWTRLATVVAMIGISGWIGLAISGCAPAPQQPQDSSVEQPVPPAAEEPAELPAPEAEQSAAEPAEKPAPEPMAAEETSSQPALEKPAQKTAPEGMEAPAKETSNQPATEKPPVDAPAAEGEEPKLSTYAPAADLASQVSAYLEELEESVEDEEEYQDSQSKLIKDANVLILISLALGITDEDNEYKKAAPAMVKASQDLAKSTDYASAKAGVEEVKAATTSTDGDPSTLKWEKVASLPELMKAVPLIHSRLKRYLRGSRFESQADKTAGLSAVLAVVGQGSMPNAGDTEKPDQVEEWHKFCVQLRDASAQVHAAVRAQDEAAAEAAMEKLQQSCDDCHAVFHPEDMPAQEEEEN